MIVYNSVFCWPFSSSPRPFSFFSLPSLFLVLLFFYFSLFLMNFLTQYPITINAPWSIFCLTFSKCFTTASNLAYIFNKYNHWSSFNMAESYKLICCDVVPEWSDCFRCLHRGIRRVDASSVDALPMVGLLPVATLWTLRDLTLPSATISSGQSL